MLRATRGFTARLRIAEYSFLNARSSKQPTATLSTRTSENPPTSGSATPEQEKPFSISKFFIEKFDYKYPDRMLQAPPGSFVTITEQDKARYFPEGFAGEIEDEFNYSGESRWMIRDAGKFLFRMIEAHENIRAGKTAGASTIVNSVVHIPKLTDRPEWHDSVMSVSYYGSELRGKAKMSLKSAADRSVPKPAGDLAEEFALKLQQAANSTSNDTSATALPDKILLTGPRGVGKSSALNQAVLHARQRGWLCLFVPRGWSLVQEGAYVEPIPHAPGIFDNPLMSVGVLRGFWRAHNKQLKEIPLTNPSALEKYEAYRAEFEEAWVRAESVQQGSSGTSRRKLDFIDMRSFVEGEDHFPELDEPDRDVLADFDYMNYEAKTLEDLVLLGIALRDLSGSICVDLINELKVLECTPVLIAIDQYNCWEVPSAFSYDDQPLIGKDHLCIPRALHFISTRKAETDNWTLKNGLCIAATSMRHTEGKKATFSDVQKSVPLTVKVPAYSQVEFLSAVAHHAHQGLLTKRLKLSDLLALRMHTGSNPRLLREEGLPFMMPRIVAELQHVFDDVVKLDNFERSRIDGDGGYDEESEIDDDATDVDTYLRSSVGGSNSAAAGGAEDTSVQSIMDTIAPIHQKSN